jgi:AbrB family looped-hinge helix DNA binding protein
MSPVMATMTSKGQVTVPRSVRETLGLQQGDPILFEERGGIVIMRKRPRPDPVWDANVCATLTEWEDGLDDDL